MNPVISEFSYGYAVTEHLINSSALRVSAAPTFPSLREEGTRGGYDLKLDFSGLFLFIQFKLSHRMIRRNCYENQYGFFEPPSYRFYLRAPRFSNQHRLLLELERTGELVFYAAPIFFEADELNDFYLTGNIIENSLFISPLEIGDLPDDNDHFVSFKPDEPIYFFSEPIMIREVLEKSNSIISFITKTFEVRKKEYNSQTLFSFANKLKQIVAANYKFEYNHDILNKLSEFNPLRQIGYLSRNFFNSEFIVISK